MSATVKTAAIAAALGVTRKAALERAKREGWPCVRQPAGVLWVEYRLPMDVRLALANAESEPADTPPPARNFTRATEKERSAAAFRGILITDWKQSGLRKEDFIAAYNSGGTDRLVFKELGPLSLRTFYRWIREFSQKGMDGITPRYSAASGGAGETLTDTEKALLERFWLKGQWAKDVVYQIIL